MYTDKKNVLQLTALLRAHGIRRIVIAPGSRNIPLTQTFTACADFECYSVTDERSAGFFALGLALESGEPAAVCCTSGSALLNLHPAVAEAYYQQVPLLVISADRPAAWIGQMDGQTLPQPGVFGTLARRSVNLPEVRSDEDAWFCNRLINEALLKLTHRVKGPVHINVPISEPFFDFSVRELPEERVIRRYDSLDDAAASRLLAETFDACPRRLVICGQCAPEKDILLSDDFPEDMIYLCENLYNGPRKSYALQRTDAWLYAATPEDKEALAPQLVITYGGHIVSKRLKQWLRRIPSLVHWHISPDGDTPDLFGRLTAVFEMSPATFFNHLEQCPPPITSDTTDFVLNWTGKLFTLPTPEFEYSSMQAIQELLETLCLKSENVTLHLANSSAVRYAELWAINPHIKVFCNRGVNGIEGSLSTAIGYAAASQEINCIVIGDLSFFYDMNALWNGHIRPNVRILLLNNSGGEIFHSLPGLNLPPRGHDFVTAVHTTKAEGWAKERGFDYLAAHDESSLHEAMKQLLATDDNPRPRLLEVFTDKDEDIRQLKAYYHSLKNKSITF